MPISWQGTLAQYVGRLHRLHAGKREVRVYDYIDNHAAMLEKMYNKRLKGYASLGYTVAAGMFILITVIALLFQKVFVVKEDY